MEFGPVTFPAYDGATAGVRSMTDEYILAHLFSEPERLQRVLEMRKEFAPTNETPAVEPPLETVSREEKENRFKNREEYLKWLTKS